jgi:hypothetical protein
MKKTKKTSITDNISAKSDANRIVKNMVMYIYTRIKVLIFICPPTLRRGGIKKDKSTNNDL